MLIRNFCILSHIDHGKSTLADRFLELTKTIEKRDMREQFLDRMDLEREKGITIKMKPIQMKYRPQNGPEIILNLIDTPGHVDFSYEVSRSLKAVEGAILLVDAVAGIQAQTVFNYYLAKKEKVAIIPAVNKIDLPSAQLDKAAVDLSRLTNFEKKEIAFISAKVGTNVKDLLERVIKKTPAPLGSSEKPLRALIFDSFYDQHKGIIAFIRIFDGSVEKGDEIVFLQSQKTSKVLEVGVFGKNLLSKDFLTIGEIGYVVTNLPEIKDCKIGDTICLLEKKTEPLSGYKPLKPMVFAAFYPIKGDNYLKLKNSLEKLSLNDPSIIFEPETTELGYGFRVGFLGPLHLEITQERLEREYGLHIISTSPQVAYKVLKKNNKEKTINSISQLPEPSDIQEIQEPWLEIKIFTAPRFVSSIFELLKNKRGIYKDTKYLNEEKIILIFEMPLISLLEEFYDKLKSISSGFASFDWKIIGYKGGNLIKVDILVAGTKISPLSFICPFQEAYSKGKNLIFKLKQIIPREQFEVSLQAAIGFKVIVRENIRALRKNVIAKLYGGDRTRKDKLLKKQKEGKERLKKIGTVNIPQEAFFALFKK